MFADKGTAIIEDSDQKGVVDHLVAQYERLFGRASHEVCREAVAALVASILCVTQYLCRYGNNERIACRTESAALLIISGRE